MVAPSGECRQSGVRRYRHRTVSNRVTLTFNLDPKSMPYQGHTAVSELTEPRHRSTGLGMRGHGISQLHRGHVPPGYFFLIL